MEKLTRLYVVLPCHSLEDFPTHYRGGEAEDLLANWTSLWHPQLVQACGRIPEWHRADTSELRFESEDDEQIVAVIPKISVSSLDDELEKLFSSNSSVCIKQNSSRPSIVEHALESLGISPLNQSDELPHFDDFHALGYAFLQTQVMTRQLRYSSNLDEARFSEVVVKAAEAWCNGEAEACHELLTRSFDLLLEEKNSYYPVDPELMDVVLTAPTTVGGSLSRQLDCEHAINLLLTGESAQAIETKNEAAVEKIREKVAQQQVTIIGGLNQELPDNLVSSETILNQAIRGREAIQTKFGTEPAVFMRRRFGLTASTPGLLDQLNFVGAVHATLDDGKFPRGSSCNIRWTGDDEKSILAFGETPLSAIESGDFLALGLKIGEAIDSAHIASILFVHWPGQTCESFDDLLRITKYSPIFGTFISLESYFEQVYDPGYGDTFAADEYRPAFLKQAVEQKQPDPVTRHARYWKRFYRLKSLRSLLTQTCARTKIDSAEAKELLNTLLDLQCRVEACLNSHADDRSVDDQLDDIELRLRMLISGGIAEEKGAAFEAINTVNFRRTVEVGFAGNAGGSLKHSPPVVFGVSDSGHTDWVVDLPPMGMAQLAEKGLDTKNHFRRDPPVHSNNLLRNEFFELEVDESTGGIRGIQVYGQRGNLGGQQLAIRIPGERDSRQQPLAKARYTKMIASGVEAIKESALASRIVSRGELVDGEKCLAKFEQIVRVVRGKPAFDLTIKLDQLDPLTQNHNHYVCSRLAWKNESSRISTNFNESKCEVNSDWFHASNFVDLIHGDTRLTMLTGGLPYHRRTSRTMIDTVLVTGCESAREFQLGFFVNVPYGMMSAIDWMTPVVLVPKQDAGALNSNWLFHFNCKNVIVTDVAPLLEEGRPWSGVQLRLRETEGRGGSLKISCPMEIQSAERTNLQGDFLEALAVDEADSRTLELDFSRFEFLQIKIHWKA